MNRKTRLTRIMIAAALAMLMAGACSHLLMLAMDVPCGWTAAYLPAAGAAALLGMGSWSGGLAIAAAVMAALTLGGTLAVNFQALGSLKTALTLFGDADALAARETAGPLLAMLAAAALCAAFYWLISRRGGTPFALALFFVMVIVCYALKDELSVGLAVPGLIAALAAFALSGEVQRDADAWRALVPAVLAVALAAALVPSQRLTWEPLEQAAQSIRETFADYFQFTKERVAFSINAEGYDHAVEENGSVISRLGGPADPDTTPVMRVTTDGDLLLRGAIHRTYTGNAWTDPDAKSRYLYYDFTHSRIRDQVFDMDMSSDAAFIPVHAEIEMLEDGTSTLFVPGRLEDFSMDLRNAVYYNSVGEMFLARDVAAGDAYSVSAWMPGEETVMAAEAARGQSVSDSGYEDAAAACLQVPDGVEEGVYSLAIQLTQDTTNPYAKALAIESWLMNNCTYNLTPEYPDSGRDFVSEFLLDSREGYCSYFASAMAVMCRIAGLPARYVEGYYVPAGENVVVTGENAHAWVEVYFNGMGWVAFNPTNGAGGGDDGLSNEEEPDETEDVPPSSSEQTPPPPTPEPTLHPGEADSTPAPTPGPGMDEPDATSAPEPTLPPETSPSVTPTAPPDAQSPDDTRSRTWLWVLLAIVLLLLAALLACWYVRWRLDAADPVRLCARAKDAAEASMILYRSILTLLASMGHTPFNGETPEAFAMRVAADNDDLAEFVRAVSMQVYARAPMDRAALQHGQRAYAILLKGMRRSERMRYNLRRIAHGLGSFESIP